MFQLLRQPSFASRLSGGVLSVVRSIDLPDPRNPCGQGLGAECGEPWPAAGRRITTFAEQSDIYRRAQRVSGRRDRLENGNFDAAHCWLDCGPNGPDFGSSGPRGLTCGALFGRPPGRLVREVRPKEAAVNRDAAYTSLVWGGGVAVRAGPRAREAPMFRVGTRPSFSPAAGLALPLCPSARSPLVQCCPIGQHLSRRQTNQSLTTPAVRVVRESSLYKSVRQCLPLSIASKVPL